MYGRDTHTHTYKTHLSDIWQHSSFANMSHLAFWLVVIPCKPRHVECVYVWLSSTSAAKHQQVLMDIGISWRLFYFWANLLNSFSGICLSECRKWVIITMKKSYSPVLICHLPSVRNVFFNGLHCWLFLVVQKHKIRWGLHVDHMDLFR